MKTHRNLLAATGLFAALALTGCGGGSDDEPAVLDRVEVSSETFVGFVEGLNGTDETSEPLPISDAFSVLANDSDEPKVL